MARHAFVLAVVLSVAVATGCGGQSAGADHPDAPKPLERWQTEKEWVLVSAERCVTGPFEVELPSRQVEFGRRITVEVYGERKLPLDAQVAYADGGKEWGWGWTNEDDAEAHAACRGHEHGGEGAEASGGGGRGGEPPSTGPGRPAGGTPGGGGPPDPRGNGPEPPLPTLERYDGPLPDGPRQAGGIRWFPQGNPNLHALDGLDTHTYGGDVRQGFRFRFWFHRPVDMKGVVLRIRDQVLVPTIAIDTYRQTFDARVADVKARIAELEARAERGEIEVIHEAPRGPAAGKVPPPPKHEVVPKAPSKNVRWVPGYWNYHADLDDFIWIEGTFVVEPPGEGTVEAGSAADGAAQARAEEPPVVEAGPEEPPEPPPVPRRVEPDVPPKPAARREVIPPPPAVAGAVWVAGHWQLEGRTWRWVRGRWQVPHRRGARYRAPSIEVRAGVKLYLPGGWFRRER